MPVRGKTAGNAGKGSKWITPQRRHAIYRRDGKRCLWCNGKGKKTLDHFTPRSLGGNDATENLLTACMNCNRKRGNQTALAFACSRRRSPAEVLARILDRLTTPLTKHESTR